MTQISFILVNSRISIAVPNVRVIELVLPVLPLKACVELLCSTTVAPR
jgi:hypothetical protein